MTTTVQTRQSRVGDGEHVVQFYDRDADLVRAVGDYLIRAVSEGEAAIVIATEPHRRDFEAELMAGGIDVARAVADGSLVWLDAAQTLASFVHEGVVDPARFRACLGPMVRAAQHGGRPLKAYGEMVALLWDAGDVLGAIEVEKLWNALGREERFALWCGYHTRSVGGDEHADALHEVCHLHSAVVDDASARFRAGPDAPSAARRFVAGLLGCRPFDGRAPTDDAQLVVSELATNAVIHAGTPVLGLGPLRRLGYPDPVHDWSPTLPVLRNGGPAAASGRGLRLVDAGTRLGRRASARTARPSGPSCRSPSHRQVPVAPRRRTSESTVTARISTIAVAMSTPAALIPISARPLNTAAMTIPPSSACSILPRPPNRLVPPITAAATAYSTKLPASMSVAIDPSRDA